MVEVVVGALVRDGRVLLGHRRPDKRAYPDVWDLPGGVMEDGESELDALARELREELGVWSARSDRLRQRGGRAPADGVLGPDGELVRARLQLELQRPLARRHGGA